MTLDPRRIEVMDDQTAEIMRRLTPQQKLTMLDELWLFGRSLTESGVRQQHPEWNEQEVQREIVRRMSRGTAF